MLSAIDSLITELGRLPSVGPRSARRLALHLLRNQHRSIPPLIAALARAVDEVKSCHICGSIDDTDPCRICADARRDPTLICVVEDIADVWAIERSGAFRGRYHVLGGTLSAIDGRGPDALRIEQLLTRITADHVVELVLALSATVSGQTTAHYVAERISAMPQPVHSEHNPPVKPVKITQLAHGIPMGGELDYMDDGTLSAALNARLVY